MALHRTWLILSYHH